MDLAKLQRAFQRHVVNGDVSIGERVNGSQAVPARQRLQVYSDAYQLRLIEALAHNYPRVRQLLGDDQFGELSRAYLKAFPSTSPSVRWFGNHLQSFVSEQYSESAALVDLVQWEWSIATAFDAADQAPLKSDSLASLEPEVWPKVRFVFHPSVALVTTHSNAVALFRALADETSMPEPQSQPSVSWLIWRYELGPRYRSLVADEEAALRTAQQSSTFEEICEVLSEWHSEDQTPVRAITLLKTWIADELLTELRTEPVQ
ncbi:MAG: DUF2063 domain-containing protein [Povalibacter sp.]